MSARCGGRGVCGCGAVECTENRWWYAFQCVWLVVGCEAAARACDELTDAFVDERD